MALDFVQYAFCSEKSNGDICGNCPNCSKVSQLIHPDLHFSYPVVGTNKTSVDYLKQWREIIATHPYFSLYDWLQYTGVENQQGNISKNECARILKTISLKAFESGQRIICIWLPEYLQKEGNRLLKAIEEPPENTTFLFITEEPDRILNTILSRCRIVRLPALPENETVVFLQEKYDIAETVGRQAFQIHDGEVNEIIKATNQMDNAFFGWFKEWFRVSSQRKDIDMMSWVDQLAQQGREKQKQFFTYGLHYLAQVRKMMYASDSMPGLMENELDLARWLSKTLSIDDLAVIFAIFEHLQGSIERNASAKIQLMSASIRLKKVFIK